MNRQAQLVVEELSPDDTRDEEQKHSIVPSQGLLAAYVATIGIAHANQLSCYHPVPIVPATFDPIHCFGLSARAAY